MIALFLEEKLKHAVIIYTSDHGQNLLDNGLKITHCSTNNTSFYEALVPFFVATEDDLVVNRTLKASGINSNAISHFNIFPSILVLMGYGMDAIHELHEASIFEKNSGRRDFISGLPASTKKIGFGNRSRMQWHSIPENIIHDNGRNQVHTNRNPG